MKVVSEKKEILYRCGVTVIMVSGVCCAQQERTEVSMTDKTIKRMLSFYEIKSSMTPNKDFYRNMKLLRDSEVNVESMSVVYCGEPYESFQNCRYSYYCDICDCIR